jgi:hypothetical protein
MLFFNNPALGYVASLNLAHIIELDPLKKCGTHKMQITGNSVTGFVHPKRFFSRIFQVVFPQFPVYFRTLLYWH